MHKGALAMKVINRIEHLLLILGLLLIAIYVAAYVHRTTLSRVELRRFRNVQGQQPAEAAARFLPSTQIKLDVSLWSEKRIAAFDQSLAEQLDPPSGVLRIPKVHLEVPVLDGTDDLTLNRGVGHIVGTSVPGEDGNVGIAGHRDGFFRVLKDVGPGDTIELVTTKRVVTYVVDQIVVVRPDDVSVLRPRSRPSLTLVTCYPFYFVGSAPQRYIVQASVKGSEGPFRQLSKQARSEPGNGLQQSTR
jgi:sortase A